MNTMRWTIIFSMLTSVLAHGGQKTSSPEHPMLSDFDRCSYVTFGADPRTQVVVHWGTADDEPSVVAYGTTPSMPETASVPGNCANHHLPLTGLTPGTLYYYSVVGKPYSGTFRTAPDSYEPFKFVAFGDNRSNHDDHQAVVDAIDAEPDVRFVLNVGDLVSDGSSTDDWEMFFTVEQDLLADHIVMIARGNHDLSYYPWDDDPLEVLFDFENYGSFDYGDVHFVWLNTEDDLDTQTTWLIYNLALARDNPAIHWIVVWLHRPPFSAGNHGNNDDVRDAFVSVFKRFGVSVVFAGHDHDYERSLPVGGTIYIVTGGGGAPLYDVGIGENTAFSLTTLEYCLVEVDSLTMRILAKNPDGEVIDSVFLHRGPHLIRPVLAVPALTCPPDSFLVVFESQTQPDLIRFGLVSFDSSTSVIVSHGSITADSSNEYTTFYSTYCYLPYSFDPGLYDLFVETSTGLMDYADNAVMVYPESMDTFNIIHITDTHYGSTEEHTNNLLHALALCDLLNPEFVLITGDICDNGKRREYYELLPYLKKMHIPLFLIPGNHDYSQEWEGIDTYKDMISKVLNYSFDYGDKHFVMLDSGPDDGFPYYHCYGFTEEQLSYLEADLSAHTDASIKIIGFHGPVFDELTPDEHGVDEFVNLCTTYGVNLALAGHTHYNKVFTADGERQDGSRWENPPQPLFIQTASCAKNETFTPRTDFRLIPIAGDEIPFITVDDDGDGYREAETAWDIWKISIDYQYNSDSTGATLIVSNQHYEDFTNCRAYFSMNPAYSYSVSGGEIEYTGTNGDIIVSFDLPARATDTIRVNCSLFVADISKIEDFNINITPNPFNGVCRITIPEGYTAAIYDQSGRAIESFSEPQHLWRPPEGLPSGVYFVRAGDGKHTLSRKILYIR
ncbi:metallophosphoesterase [bacterium]|nr:metallophosphoesterase [bacterium]